MSLKPSSTMEQDPVSKKKTKKNNNKNFKRNTEGERGEVTSKGSLWLVRYKSWHQISAIFLQSVLLASILYFL